MTETMERPEDDPLDEFADCLHGALHGETCDFDRVVASGVTIQLPWRTDELLGSGELPVRIVVESESSASTLSGIGEHHEQVASELTDIIERWDTLHQKRSNALRTTAKTRCTSVSQRCRCSCPHTLRNASDDSPGEKSGLSRRWKPR